MQREKQAQQQANKKPIVIECQTATNTSKHLIELSRHKKCRLALCYDELTIKGTSDVNTMHDETGNQLTESGNIPMTEKRNKNERNRQKENKECW